MRKVPKFVLLRAFEAAARLESFTKAAAELHLTPSAISHQVRELEDYFGRRLFIRRNRKVEQTLEGNRLFQNLDWVFDAIEAACADVARMPGKQEVLAVHCAPSFALNWLGPRLADFMRTNPRVVVKLTTGEAPVDLTESRELDVAISYGFAKHSPGVQILGLGKERIAPMAGPALAKQSSAESLILASPLIESQLSPVTWRDWFIRSLLMPPAGPQLSFDRAAMAISAAADGMGLVLESTRLAERELARGALIELHSKRWCSLSRELHFLAFRSNERQDQKVRSFCRWLLNSMGLQVEAAIFGARRQRLAEGEPNS